MSENASTTNAPQTITEALRQTTPVRVLNIADAWGNQLCWAQILSPEEKAARGIEGYMDGLRSIDSEVIALPDLGYHNRVFEGVRASAPSVAAFPGCGNYNLALTDQQWDDLAAEQARIVEERETADRNHEAEESARIAGLFDLARTTGEPQVLESWMGDDYSIPDNSYSAFDRLAMPDGTERVIRTPTY